MENHLKKTTMNMIERVQHLVEEHEAWRGSCLNLIASENVMSNRVRSLLSSELGQRYGDYLGRDLSDRKYFGNRFLVEIERILEQLALQIFDCKAVEFRSTSGHVAGAAVIMALTQPGDLVLELGREGGGHRLTSKLTVTALARVNVDFLPFDPVAYNLDIEAASRQIAERKPRLVILGSSNFLFPEPVAAVREAIAAHSPETRLAYDASHVFGLIAGAAFQKPLAEGAEIMFGSTHKTLGGPPGGLIMADDRSLMEKISESVYPGLLTNHHVARSPALALALLEAQLYGKEISRRTVRNAKSLGRAMESEGLNVVASGLGYTESHTLLLATPGQNAAELGKRLESAGIITNPALLPDALGSSGLRLGTQEITRYGLTEEHMPEIAGLLAAVLLHNRDGAQVGTAVRDFVSRTHLPALSWCERL